MNEAFIGLIGGLIGSFLTFIIGYFGLKFKYKELFAKTVSENRMIWINTIRAAITKIISIHYAFNSVDLSNDSTNDCYQMKVELIKNFYENINIVRTRINPNEYKHQILDIYLRKLVIDDDRFSKQIEDELNFIITDLMKYEWERVKKEARGERDV